MQASLALVACYTFVVQLWLRRADSVANETYYDLRARPQLRAEIYGYDKVHSAWSDDTASKQPALRT